MKIKFGYPETLLIFSAIIAPTNMTLCFVGVGLSILGALGRMSLEHNEKEQAQQDVANGARVITEVLSNAIRPKADDRNNLH